MKNKFKRVLSLILTFAMVISYVPTPAYATEIVGDVIVEESNETEHEHSFVSVVTEPTCTEEGFTTYTCECEESYTDDKVEATGHSYADGVCSDCGAEEPADESAIEPIAYEGEDQVAPARPTAAVTKIANKDLTFALNFKADEVTPEQLAYYGNWYADFELTVNKDVTFNANGGADGYLSGQYDEWSKDWINVPFKDVTLKAGETLKIMEYAAEMLGEGGLNLTYNDVYTSVKDFDCGVYLTPEFLAENPDLKVTLELRMYNPDKESESYKIGNTYEYTPADIAKEFPTATVTKIANKDLTFALNFKADEVTPEQLAYYGNWYADFELTFNKDVTFNANGGADGYLSGQYDEWSKDWINVPFKDVTLKAGETLKIMEYAAEMLGEGGLKLTYNDVYTSVKDFDCGVYLTPEFLAANPDLKVTLELRMYNPDKESESYTIGNTYEYTPADIAKELPTATVTKIANKDLTFALNFKADEVTPEQLAYYGNWFADFELTVNKDVTFNANGGADGYLSGQYDEWSKDWINVPFKDVTLKAGETLKIMEYAAEMLGEGGLKLTYNDVYTSVKDFDCGVYFTPEFLAANPDLKVTLELRMYNPDKESESYTIGDTYAYTPADIAKELPTAAVTKIANKDLTFALNFKAEDVTPEQLAYYGNWYADFELTVNKDVTFNANGGADGYLSGQYDEWSKDWINVPFKDVTLKAGETLKIMEYAAEMLGEGGLKLTYNDVYTSVKDFDCGVYLTPEFLAANEDLEVTLELRMYNPDKESESYTIGNTYEYTAPAVSVPKADKVVNNIVDAIVGSDAEESEKAEVKEVVEAAVKEVINVLHANEAVNEQKPFGKDAENSDLVIELVKIEVDVETVETNPVPTSITYDVQPVINGIEVNNLDEAITFLLPVPAGISATEAEVFHDSNSMGMYPIKGTEPERYVEISSATFSPYKLRFATEEATYVAEINGVGYATLEEAIAAANAGDTVKVLTDIVLEKTVTVAADKELKLDLNGKTISQEKACTASYSMIENKGKLTITGNGKISFKDTGAGDSSFGWGSYTIRNEGTLVVENGTIEHLGQQNTAGNVKHMYCAIFQYSGSTTIEGGTISTPTYRSVRLWHGDMTINGGNFEGQVWVQSVDNSAELTITGGTFAPRGGDGSSVFVGNVTDGNYYEAELNVTGGTFETKIGCNSAVNVTGVKIKGGTFTAEAVSGTNVGLIANGFEFKADANGTYGVVEANYVAEVNGVKYESLEAAINAADAGDTVTLLADVAVGALDVAKSITIDGNGYSINPADAQTTYNSAIMAGNSGWGDDHGETITLKNIKFNGWKTNYGVVRAQGVTLAVEGCTFENCNASNDAYGVLSCNYTDATVANCTFKGNTSKVIDVNYNADKSNSVVNIENCTFTGNTSKGAGIVFRNASVMNVKDCVFTDNTVNTNGNAATIYVGFGAGNSVTGCTFENNTVITSHATTKRFASAIFCDGCTVNGNAFGEGNTAIRNGEAISTVVAVGAYYGAADISGNYWGGEAPVAGENYTIEYTRNEVALESYYKVYENSELKELVKFVAEVNGVKYATLSEAFAAVTSDNDDVIILENCTEELTGAYLRGNIKTENGKKVTITLTNSDWVYMPYTFVLGADITLKMPAMFYYAGGTVIEGTVITNAYYQRYAGTKLTIKEPGSLAVTSESFIVRYMDGDHNAGIYIVGDKNPETVGLSADVIYFYQGMINAKDADIVAKTYWQTQGTDGQGSANLVLDNSTLNVTVNEHNLEATGNSTVTLTNGSKIIAANGFKTEASTKVAMDTTSAITAKKVTGNGTFTIDASAFTSGEVTVITADMNGFNGAINVVDNDDAAYEIAGGKVVVKEAVKVAEVNGVGYATLAEAIAAAQNGETVTVIEDIVLAETVTIPAGKVVTLDLNGKTVSMVYTEKAVKNHTMISNSGDLTIVDSGSAGKLSYTYAGENIGTSYSVNTITSNPGSVLTVKSGTIENRTYDNSVIAYAIDGLTNGNGGDVTVNIEGGTITSLRQAVRIFANSTTNTGILNISGGDITGRVIVQNASAKANKATLSITGGTFTPNAYKTDVLYVGGSESATIDINATVSGGTFNGAISDTNVKGFISGGEFKVKPAADLAIADHEFKANANGTYGVVEVTYVAQIGDTKYATLQDAIDAADGKTVKVLEDIVLAKGVEVAAGKVVTLDLNGKTITGKPAEAKAYAVITNNGTLTITGNGAVVCESELAGSTGYAVNTITNCGTLTVNNGTIANTFKGEGSQIGYAIDNNSTVNDAVLVINGGEITASGSVYYDGIRQFMNSTTNDNSVTVNGGEVSTIWTQNPSAENAIDVKGSVSITGGEVDSLYLEPSANLDASITNGTIGTVSYYQKADGRNAVNFISGGNFVTKPDDTFAAEGYVFTTEADENGFYTLTENKDVVAVNVETGVQYIKLEDAIMAATSGQTVKLLTNVTVSTGINIFTGITLDLCGYSINTPFFVAFKDNKVIDSSDLRAAKIITTRLILAEDNGGYVPVFDGEAYMLYAPTMNQRIDDVSSEYVDIRFKPKFDHINNTIVNLFADNGAEDNEVKIVVELGWYDNDVFRTQEFEYSESGIKTIYTNNTASAFGLKISGLGSLAGQTVYIRSMVVTESGAIASSVSTPVTLLTAE